MVAFVRLRAKVALLLAKGSRLKANKRRGKRRSQGCFCFFVCFCLFYICNKLNTLSFVGTALNFNILFFNGDIDLGFNLISGLNSFIYSLILGYVSNPSR